MPGPTVEDAPDLQDFLATIETGINLIGFELRQTKDQETGRTVYILVRFQFSTRSCRRLTTTSCVSVLYRQTNSVQDTAAKLATEYKAEEIAYFKAIASFLSPPSSLLLPRARN